MLFVFLLVSAILCASIYLVSTLLALLFETGLSSAIDPAALTTTESRDDEHLNPIPKIIHQTWKNETIPESWSIAQYSCVDLHPDYQYIVSLPHSTASDIHF